MAKAIYVCYRNNTVPEKFDLVVESLSQRLVPDHIEPSAPIIKKYSGVGLGIVNPNPTIYVNNLSTLLGSIVDQKNWHIPSGNVPSGSFALFRSDSYTVEICTDMLNSRTIWYYFDDEVFISSTSQRAVITYLQNFKPNRVAYSWMLSSGTLGPGNSWDYRLKAAPGNGRVVLDRKNWVIHEHKEPLQFEEEKVPDEIHIRNMEEKIKDTFQKTNLDPLNWSLLLSGGMDSRINLLHLQNPEVYKGITWGLKKDLSDKKNDAFIAKQLAKHTGLEHEYYYTDIADNESPKTILERFISAGEGRIDHIAGYMDGFQIWKKLYDDQVHGIIRGDQLIGGFPESENIRKHQGMLTLNDYDMDLSMFGDLASIQQLPKIAEQQENENLSMWRDRLKIEWRVPTFLAALNELKLSYVEISNPLMSTEITSQVLRMPEHLRSNKKAIIGIAEQGTKEVPFAKRDGNANIKEILDNPLIAKEIYREVESSLAKSLFPSELIEYVLVNMKTSGQHKTMKKQLMNVIKSNIPSSVKVKMKDKVIKQNLYINQLAFRMYIISKIDQIIAEDIHSTSKNIDERTKINMVT